MLAKVNCPRWRPSHSALVTLFFVAIFTTLFFPILLSDRLLANGDALLYYLPAFVSPRTLWTTALYGGYPIAADPQAESWYPVGFLFLHRRELWNLFVLSAYVLAGSFTYGYIYSLTDSPLAAAGGGIAYSMSGFMIAHMGHTAIIHTAACMRWLTSRTILHSAKRSVTGLYPARIVSRHCSPMSASSTSRWFPKPTRARLSFVGVLSSRPTASTCRNCWPLS